jgi:hypothetical protein
MNELRDRFYAERDRRTRQYGGLDTALERPVRIVVGTDAAQTRAGQVATLALTNMVARVHRRVTLEIPHAPLLARALVEANELDEAVRATALAINPYLEIRSSSVERQDAAASIGVGLSVPNDVDFTLTWHGGRGELLKPGGPATVPGGQLDDEAVISAAAASVLGAWCLFRLVHDQPVGPAVWSPFECVAGSTGPTVDAPRAVDVGHVQVIGAGAVASALVYWLRELGVACLWEVVDGDVAELHNTNRCLCLLAADVGWPNGEPTGQPAMKATALAPMIDAKPRETWYDSWDGVDRRPDLILPLANARGVRPLIAARGEPVLLHATTSARWTAELHRHIPGLDDCPACRLPDAVAPTFECSTGPSVPEKPDSPDAALPFLSAAAGLLLVVGLLQLSSGNITEQAENHWLLDFAASAPEVRSYRHPPRDGCTHQLSQAVRRAVQHGASRRWDEVRPD